MARSSKPGKTGKQIEALVHEKARRKVIPTAELAPVAERIEEIDPVRPVRFARAAPLSAPQIAP